MATFPTVTPHLPIVKIPEFSTYIVDYGNKVEQRLSQWSGVRYRFQIKWDLLSIENMERILAFYLARKGTFESFYFQNAEEAYRKKRWIANTVYTIGEIVHPIPINGRSYKCTTGGTSGGTQPSWPVTANGTVNDSTVVWTENSYKVRFAVDEVNFEFFVYSLYNLQQIELIEVTA